MCFRRERKVMSKSLLAGLRSKAPSPQESGRLKSHSAGCRIARVRACRQQAAFGESRDLAAAKRPLWLERFSRTAASCPYERARATPEPGKCDLSRPLSSDGRAFSARPGKERFWLPWLSPPRARLLALISVPVTFSTESPGFFSPPSLQVRVQQWRRRRKPPLTERSVCGRARKQGEKGKEIFDGSKKDRATATSWGWMLIFWIHPNQTKSECVQSQRPDTGFKSRIGIEKKGDFHLIDVFSKRKAWFLG